VGLERKKSVDNIGIDVAAPRVDDLSRRLSLGDESALSEVYATHGPSVRAYVSRFVPDSEIDDVTQQTFIELWRSRERLDSSRPLIAFLLGVARKRSIDQLRKRRHDVVDVSQLRELVGRDGDELVNQLVWASEVRRGLDSLPQDQRTVIVMAYFEDLTQVEISRRLDVPLGTVKARMSRGLARLAQRIEQEELML
jgi:RNA polymerase sigma-70 factor (ECF subfamily)